jgi:hypothetical protein
LIHGSPSRLAASAGQTARQRHGMYWRAVPDATLGDKRQDHLNQTGDDHQSRAQID